MPRYIEAVRAERPPIYLRVPLEHSQKWKKYCHQYQACGQRVYFVKDSWYEHEYVPRYQERHGHHGKHEDNHNGHSKNGQGHDNGRDKGSDRH